MPWWSIPTSPSGGDYKQNPHLLRGEGLVFSAYSTMICGVLA
jgi:hypothetical protein